VNCTESVQFTTIDFRIEKSLLGPYENIQVILKYSEDNDTKNPHSRHSSQCRCIGPRKPGLSIPSFRRTPIRRTAESRSHKGAFSVKLHAILSPRYSLSGSRPPPGGRSCGKSVPCRNHQSRHSGECRNLGATRVGMSNTTYWVTLES
jgi:hypothetical protein